MTEKRYRVEYSVKAKDDLRAIYSYIAFTLKAPLTAKRQLNRLREAAKALAVFPERHESVDFEKRNDIKIRKVIVDNYVIFYVINAASVTVSRIFYGGRDLRRMTDEAI